MSQHLLDKSKAGELTTNLSNLSPLVLRKLPTDSERSKNHNTLKQLRCKKDIVILKADKGDGVVLLDRADYDKAILKIITETSKFQYIEKDPTLTRD